MSSRSGKRILLTSMGSKKSIYEPSNGLTDPTFCSSFFNSSDYNTETAKVIQDLRQFQINERPNYMRKGTKVTSVQSPTMASSPTTNAST